MPSSVDFYDFTMSHARLAVLRMLQEAPAYSANDSVLSQSLEQLGFPITRDQLRSQLGWLEEQGLVELQRPTPVSTLIVVRLRERGVDVASGRAQVEGVQRPSAGR